MATGGGMPGSEKVADRDGVVVSAGNIRGHNRVFWGRS